MCIILVANIIWRSGHPICSSFLLDFPFLHIVANVSSQFSTSQLYNIIVLADTFGRQIVLSMHKKIRENSLGTKVDYF